MNPPADRAKLRRVLISLLAALRGDDKEVISIALASGPEVTAAALSALAARLDDTTRDALRAEWLTALGRLYGLTPPVHRDSSGLERERTAAATIIALLDQDSDGLDALVTGPDAAFIYRAAAVVFAASLAGAVSDRIRAATAERLADLRRRETDPG